MSRRVLVASRNAKKLNELRRILAEDGVEGLEIIGLDEVPPYEEAPETGATFEENALAKARDGAAATGLACVADDSGISVDALNGMPGVLSARWSGGHGDDAANNELLLAQLRDVPDERRGARFVSACALVADGREVVMIGEWPGRVAREPAGAGGFGYDPLFVPDGGGVSAAELTPAEKDAASHRGRALRALLPALEQLAQS
ncbi:RdgB/HAM1 family non-canonical purine NTP pyrophosphatase [Nocardia sp. alder85J]|uniref:RdgB/HAM1 family non-canonical purine NTP pyrophosphatase n=1 Tax=Nocardia sp. alder85J TaxID=2862949 RepID=UPI001CD19494|nr:RdgB/HAM1 family non-canonical purine NTP pyrophosphatase [Nocardia sp. alder85J]MCX4092022.1 RdgB/HAM1 family non-canonical purine NTP pyrophosphatase [Nocardia sp. alder85J]